MQDKAAILMKTVSQECDRISYRRCCKCVITGGISHEKRLVAWGGGFEK